MENGKQGKGQSNKVLLEGSQLSAVAAAKPKRNQLINGWIRSPCQFQLNFTFCKSCPLSSFYMEYLIKPASYSIEYTYQ